MMDERNQQQEEQLELPRVYLFGNLPEGCEDDCTDGTAD